MTSMKIKEHKENDITLGKFDLAVAYVIGAYEATQLVFFGLKLLLDIPMTWFWIASPTWIVAVCIALYFVISKIAGEIKFRWWLDSKR